jgi:hypothetical protein
MLKLVERKTYEPVTFEAARPELEQEVHQRKVMEKYREWMEDLRKRTYIERRGYFAQAATFAAPRREPGTLASGAATASDAATDPEEPPATP